ncbi:MAG: M90 family metallopeptidase [Cyanobacteriota bacterium]|nr:M90 family metallopeptidase [Cyanobacteriota bacterium]
MIQAILFLFILSATIAGIWGIDILKQRRRRRLQRKPFPPYWIAVIQQNFPLYKHLPEDLARRLQGDIQVFLAEKNFIGCGGLEITDEIKLAIAAPACLLLLNERGNYFAQLKDILVYPSAFIANSITPLGNTYLERQDWKSGESWQKGMVILSWEDIKRDAINWRDGRNVIFHEFAHQLDQENGAANGVPTLDRRSDYHRWAQVFERTYRHFCDRVRQGKKTPLNEYGATHPAEFFAVATETFFEKPKSLKATYGELYDELKWYYNLDPLAWLHPPQTRPIVPKSAF